MIARTTHFLLLAFVLAMFATKVSADVFSDSMPFAQQINEAGEAFGRFLQDNNIIDKPSGGEYYDD
ncbi:MAG: hypothetical protein J3R72DRAFT_525378, partial [Linnemannia gamsii]